MAAVLACGEGAVLSHRSAAHLLGLRSSSRDRIEVLVEGSAPRGKSGIQVHRTAHLPVEDIVKRDGIPCTSVARSLLDLAEVVNARQLARAVDEAERLRLFDRTAVDHALERRKGRKGASRLLAAVQTYEDTGTRSELERRFAELSRQAGLPRPQANVLVEGLEVDFAWPDRRLIVETDGHAYHHTRRAFEEDRRRDQLLAAKGWRVVRFTWRQIAGEAERVEQTLRALAA